MSVVYNNRKMKQYNETLICSSILYPTVDSFRSWPTQDLYFRQY